MNTQKQSQQRNDGQTGRKIPFYVIFGGLHPSSEKEQRIQDFWIFCHALLWPSESFTDEQEKKFRSLIREHFNDHVDYSLQFLELAERAILAKQYICRKAGRFTPRPENWLNIRYAKGLTGTAPWYMDFVVKRLLIPGYREFVSLLASAVLDYVINGDEETVIACRQKFIAEKQCDLLTWYTRAIFFFQFVTK